MFARHPTTWLPILSLLVALILVTHDAAMATGPHDSAGHATLHDARAHHPTESAPHGDESTACGELEAARTRELTRDPDSVTFASPVDALPPAPGTAVAASRAEPGAPPGQLRALLQVWLN